MSKRIYTPEEITEIAGNVASKIEETGSLVEAMDELTSNGAPEVSLTTMSAGLTLLSIIPNSTNSLPITAPIAKVAQALAVGAIGQEAGDDEFTWDDVAALSTAIAPTLATIPEPTEATKIAAALFGILGFAMPYLNAGGYWVGKETYRFINSDTNLFFNQSKNWMPPHTDPLVLDLDNDGIETIGIGNTVVVFDHDGDGIKTGTGWVNSDDGFLILDRNENGTIDTGAELFGIYTAKTDGALATDGFDALR